MIHHRTHIADRFELNGYTYELETDNNGWSEYKRTLNGNLCSEYVTKAEFELRKQEYTEQTELKNLF